MSAREVPPAPALHGDGGPGTSGASTRKEPRTRGFWDRRRGLTFAPEGEVFPPPPPRFMEGELPPSRGFRCAARRLDLRARGPPPPALLGDLDAHPPDGPTPHLLQRRRRKARSLGTPLGTRSHTEGPHAARQCACASQCLPSPTFPGRDPAILTPRGCGSCPGHAVCLPRLPAAVRTRAVPSEASVGRGPPTEGAAPDPTAGCAQRWVPRMPQGATRARGNRPPPRRQVTRCHSTSLSSSEVRGRRRACEAPVPVPSPHGLTQSL